jgi:hypothetical protein
MFSAGQFVMTERAGDHQRIPSFGWIPSIIGTAVGVAIAWWIMLRGPSVTFVPVGLVIRTFRTHRVEWDAFAPGGPPPPPSPVTRLELRLAQPSLAERQPWLALPVRALAVDPTFLANAIHHYVDHPKHRAAIGTPEEYDRLHTAIAPALSTEPAKM